MPDLRDKITAAIDRAEEVARAADGSLGFISLDWPRTPAKDALIEHVNIWRPAAVLRRCAADRRVLERHEPVVESVEWWDSSDGTGTAQVCSHCGNREPNEWELGVGNYEVKPQGWVSSYVLWPCAELLDCAARWGVEIGDHSGS